jgi:non-canonical purine NTP pyrophosphatase (RdgB/HAM1 family)
MKHILFVSENVSKYKEIENYLKNINNINNSNISIQMIKPELEIQEIQSLDRSQIIIRKLQDAYSTIKSLINHQSHNQSYNQSHNQNILYSNEGTWIMVEDTSLNIAKMGGFPGTFIKYYLQSLPISSISHANWGSNATSYVTLGICRYLNDLDNDIVEDNVLSARVFEGFIEGVIIEPRGTNGFGYDPIFRPNGSLLTNAEMSMDEKEKFNPRTIAFQKVINLLMT